MTPFLTKNGYLINLDHIAVMTPPTHNKRPAIYFAPFQGLADTTKDRRVKVEIDPDEYRNIIATLYPSAAEAAAAADDIEELV